jgi:hypothetical protein
MLNYNLVNEMNEKNHNRLVPHWTETLEEAYGKTGALGREGELWLINEIRSWGWDVMDFEDNKGRQLKGHDIAIRKPTWFKSYTVDVKNNLRNDGSFVVDTTLKGWLRNENKTSDRIWHVNTKTGWMAWYDRKEMIKYLTRSRLLSQVEVVIKVSDKLSFITRARSKNYGK